MATRTTLIVVRPLRGPRPPRRNGVRPAITARGRKALAGVEPRRSPEVAWFGEW